MELERHGAHLHLDILRLALGAFPSYLIDLLLGAAVLFAAHFYLCGRFERTNVERYWAQHAAELLLAKPMQLSAAVVLDRRFVDDLRVLRRAHSPQRTITSETPLLASVSHAASSFLPSCRVP